jgi:hypothetical protein
MMNGDTIAFLIKRISSVNTMLQKTTRRRQTASALTILCFDPTCSGVASASIEGVFRRRRNPSVRTATEQKRRTAEIGRAHV